MSTAPRFRPPMGPPKSAITTASTTTAPSASAWPARTTSARGRFGEVKKPETINYRTYRPEKDGLFCERIFGPEKDWECTCGKYRGMKYKGMICDRCGVKVTHSRVRRKRMGHIELAAPVVHIWFFKAMPSRLGTLLDMKTTQPGKDHLLPGLRRRRSGPRRKLKERQLLTEDEYRTPAKSTATPSKPTWAPRRSRSCSRSSTSSIVSARTARAAREGNARKATRPPSSGTKELRQAAEDHREPSATRSNKCEWMVLECIPVIPPDLRPLVLLDSGNFATSDLNDLYRRIINRNNRLKKLVDLNAPEVIIRNEKRMLQQSVDALFDNNRCKRPVLGSQQPPAQVADRHDQGQAGPLPREPARQARRLLGPLGHRRRPGTQAAPVRSAEEDRARTLPAVHHPPAQGTRPGRHDQVGQEDARTQGRRRSGTSSKK